MNIFILEELSFISFSNVSLGVGQGQACTIVLRGATQQILDEAERSIHDVLCVLSQTVKEPRICYGGGELKKAYLTILKN